LLKNIADQQELKNVTVLAHSLGNLVVSAAIQDGLSYDRFIMANPAVAEEAYLLKSAFTDGTAWESSTKYSMFHPKWRFAGDMEEGYDPFLWSSEWYKQFAGESVSEPSVSRYDLTWRDVFSKVRDDAKSYVFYANTDEAFLPFNYSAADAANGAGYPDNRSDWPGLWDVWENVKCADVPFVGTYSWAFQELFKGQYPWLSFIVPDSQYGGWGFTSTDLMSPQQANNLDRDLLKTKPFFSKNPKYEDKGVYSDTPNVALKKHEQEELLANEMPALTFAAGHGGIDDPTFYKRNFEVRERYLGGEGASWPRKLFDKVEWRHNDIAFVAYPYLCRLYFDWVKLINGESL
jgi:hypothetical protein